MLKGQSNGFKCEVSFVGMLAVSFLYETHSGKTQDLFTVISKRSKNDPKFEIFMPPYRAFSLNSDGRKPKHSETLGNLLIFKVNTKMSISKKWVQS